MPLDRNSRRDFKSLLLGLPGWNQSGSRKAFLNDVFFGDPLLTRLRFDVAGDQAADELIEELASLESPTVDGLTPACALLKAVREMFGAGPTREPLIAGLESDLCLSVEKIRSVLFLAANPDDQGLMRTGFEFRRIQEVLAQPRQGDRITVLLPQLAAQPNDLTRALHDNRPSLVHFSGHGGGEGGLYLEDGQGSSRPVSADALAAVFRQFGHCVKVVVLNACFSKPQSEAIGKHIDYVIGTRRDIGDDTAIAFSVGFYQALAAGRSVEDAFQLGCAEIRMEGIPEHLVPMLMKRSGGMTTCMD